MKFNIQKCHHSWGRRWLKAAGGPPEMRKASRYAGVTETRDKKLSVGGAWLEASNATVSLCFTHSSAELSELPAGSDCISGDEDVNQTQSLPLRNTSCVVRGRCTHSRGSV